MRASLVASCLLGFLVLSLATGAGAQHLETTPAAVVDPRNVEIGYRALGTEAGAEANEIGIVTGIGPAFDLGVIAPRPMFATHGPGASDAGVTLRHLLHGTSGGPCLLLAASSGTARPLDAPPLVFLAASHTTPDFAWHSNVGVDGEVFATTRVEGPLGWRLRPALELKQRALTMEAVGVGALLQVSERLTVDAGARFTETALPPTFGAGLTYVLPSSEPGA